MESYKKIFIDAREDLAEEKNISEMEAQMLMITDGWKLPDKMNAQCIDLSVLEQDDLVAVSGTIWRHSSNKVENYTRLCRFVKFADDGLHKHNILVQETGKEQEFQWIGWGLVSAIYKQI